MSGFPRVLRHGARLAGMAVAGLAASLLLVGAAVAGPPPDETTTTTTAPETTTTAPPTTTAPEPTTPAPEQSSQGEGDVGTLAVHQVTTGLDAGAGSYRAAIIAANGDGNPVTINFNAGLMVTLTTGDVVYTNAQPITLNGNGSTIDGSDANQILDAANTTSITVNNLTMRNGESPDDGGAIDASSADITVNNSTFTGNSAGSSGGGGATRTSGGSHTISNSTFSGNTAGIGGGGATQGGGSYTISNSTFSGNTAAGAGGGGAYTGGGSYTISNSTFSGNTATTDGGGATRTSGGNYTISNSTFSGNTAAGGDEGGGVFALGGDVTLAYSTMVGNTAAIGANVDSDALTSFGSVVAMPLGGGANCDATTMTTRGWNFSDDTSCGFTDTSRGDNQAVGNNPQLGALANNGGPTQTHMPQPGSPLRNAIPGAHCQDFEAGGVTTDQRGVFRPQGPGCDIGAVERRVCPPASQASVGIGTLAGAEGVVAVAPLGLPALFRRRRRRAVGESGPTGRERARSVVTWLMVAGVAVAVLAACQPVKKTPPLC